MNARFVSVLALGGALLCGVARAQDAAPPAAAAAPASSDGPTDAQKAEAKTHFDKGIALFEEEAWDAALAEFSQSRALFATRSATKNAALSLRKLHRFDEALDMFDTLLKDFPSLPPEDKAVADAQIKELTGLVGAVVLQGIEPGAKVVIDGRQRGEAPLGPLRVSAGTHLLRVSCEGFAPFETQLTVAGAQSVTVAVKQAPLLQGGRLRVEEVSGKNVDVVVDGAVAGKAPWEGMLPVGDHVVTLRGDGDLGTQPSLATVRLNASTPLTLRAESLPAALRVEPSPAVATVFLDGVSIGRGAWNGNVRQGSHLIELRAEGYVSEVQRVQAPAGKETRVSVALRAAEGSQDKPGRVFVEADGAFALGPSFGGDLASGCAGKCKSSVSTGFSALGRGGYQLGSGLGFAVDAGYLSLSGSVTNRAVALHPMGLADNDGTATDHLKLSGLMLGPSAQFQHGEKFPFVVRLGVGALVGSLQDERSGTATTIARTVAGNNVPAQTYSFDVSESPKASYLYIAPEVRTGIRLGDHVELSAGVRVLVLVALSQPKWGDENPVTPGGQFAVGQLRFGSQAVGSSTVFLVSPGGALRYDF